MGSIGRWLDTQCTPVMEDRLLTTKLVPFQVFDEVDAGCLGGVAFGCVAKRNGWSREGWFEEVGPGGLHLLVPVAFNALCLRLEGQSSHRYRQGATRAQFVWEQETSGRGAARAAVLVRNRILKNRAHRALQAAPVVRRLPVAAR